LLQRIGGFQEGSTERANNARQPVHLLFAAISQTHANRMDPTIATAFSMRAFNVGKRRVPQFRLLADTKWDRETETVKREAFSACEMLAVKTIRHQIAPRADAMVTFG
jgi:hypothetical protein